MTQRRGVPLANLAAGGDKVIGMQAQADLGFIVVQIDGMGTANRSKAFHDVAWKNLADSGFPDRILWHKALAARDPSHDIGRVGIYGASAGGQSALNALLFHPDFYQAAVAYAGCYDKDFELLVVPGGEHSVGRSTGPIRYVQRRQFEFFIRALQDTLK